MIFIAKSRALAKAERYDPVYRAVVRVSDIADAIQRARGCADRDTGRRPQPGGIRAVVGLFINQVVMRGDLSGNPTFSEVLKRNRRAS